MIALDDEKDQPSTSEGGTSGQESAPNPPPPRIHFEPDMVEKGAPKTEETRENEKR